jgi:hypothetical protein
MAADAAYRLSVTHHDAVGYVAFAEALGRQADDTPCRFLRMTFSGGQTVTASGADPDAGNGELANRRCWNR